MDTRAVVRWGSGVVGLALAYHEGRRAPVVLAVTVIAIAASAWIANSRAYNRSPNRTARRFYPVRLAGLLALGLWLGVFLVLSVADSGSESPISTEVPVSFDGAGISAGALLIHGVASSIAVLAVMVAFTATGRRSRRREGRGSQLSALATKRATNSSNVKD
jgi:hypothetical protein